MSEKIAHLHHDGGIDATSLIQPDPDRVDSMDVELGEYMETGIACRVLAIRDGRCPCDAVVIRMNRSQRRKFAREMGQGVPMFTGYVRHVRGCPAMSDRVRQFLYQHRRQVVAA